WNDAGLTEESNCHVRTQSSNHSVDAGPKERRRSLCVVWVYQSTAEFIGKQALEMGAEYRPDWDSNCTLLDKQSSHPAKEIFSPSQVKKWAIDGFIKTISWLETQKEKASSGYYFSCLLIAGSLFLYPDPSEIKHVAAEGIFTCLQDAIDSLEQKQQTNATISFFFLTQTRNICTFSFSHTCYLSISSLYNFPFPSFSLYSRTTMVALLPPKEANLFKLIVKSYETKQYKKGLKAADAILKRFPDHGETLSMKGLTLNCMDRKAEAYDLVRLGLKNDLKSHVCWHVYGLLYRSDREYREAIKCYRNALRIDQDNIEILRDLSLLQAQMRDLAGFVETRQQLLTLKPNHRMNWIGFAVAHHLNSNAAKAVEILEAYEGTLEDDYPPDNERCEHAEMLLYKISLLEECGFLERALEELHKKQPKIVDKLAYKEQEVSLLLKLGHLEEGSKIFKALLSMNPDNYRYYEGLQKCVGLHSENGHYSSDEIDQLKSLYKSLQEQYTSSSAVKVMYHVIFFLELRWNMSVL
ncbi:hypothetical protein SLEP1_g43971, partial [Rubroshorea leprosula]